MSLLTISVDRAEALTIVKSNMRAFLFDVESRPALAYDDRLKIGTTVEFVGVDEDGQVLPGEPLIRSIRAVLSARELPLLPQRAALLLLDVPGSSDPNYAEAVQRVQQQRQQAGLSIDGLQMETLMQAQLETLNKTPTRRERLAGFALQEMIGKYGKGDAEIHGAHVAQQAVCWADALIAELDKPVKSS